MNMLHSKTRLIGLLVGSLILAPGAVSRAQTNEDQELAARRQAILQQDQLVTEDGQIISQDEVLVPPPVSVAPARAAAPVVRASEPQTQVVYQPVNRRGRFYGRPNAGFYYGPPRAYRNWDYGPSYYRSYYGYHSHYYGTPRFGYYDSPYGGTARVGPLRFYWR